MRREYREPPEFLLSAPWPGLGCIDILSEPSPCAGDGDGGLEVLFEFIEAGGEAAELLEVGEGAFDAVALAVEGAVEAALHLADGSRRDDGGDAAFVRWLRMGSVS